MQVLFWKHVFRQLDNDAHVNAVNVAQKSRQCYADLQNTLDVASTKLSEVASVHEKLERVVFETNSSLEAVINSNSVLVDGIMQWEEHLQVVEELKNKMDKRKDETNQ